MFRLVRVGRRYLERNREILTLVVGLCFAVIGFLALSRLLAQVRLRDVRSALAALQSWQVASALGLTIASYLLLTCYDFLALRIIGKPLPWRTAALASFTSYTFSHNLGFALLTGGSARYRVYRASGLEMPDIVNVIATASMTFWSGVIVMAAVALVAHPAALAIGSAVISPDLQRYAGVAVLGAVAWLVFWLGRQGRQLRLRGWSLPLPSAGQALGQIGVAALDLAASSSALFVLVPGVHGAMLGMFLLSFVLAILVAQLTHVPGGIGVFEAVLIAAMPTIGKPGLLAALFIYRAIYYLLPLLLAAVLLIVHERRHWREPVGSALKASHSVIAGIAPVLLSALAFAGGTILLISGSLPAIPARLHSIRHFVPLPFVEASHIAASLAGTGLLLLAPGLYRRLDSAFILTRILLVSGAVFSLVKGGDYEEAIILLAIAGLLQGARASFYRHSALTMRSFSAEWIVTVAVALGLSLWIGFFSFKHVDYQNDLWWQFAWRGDASRFMRASFAAAVLLVCAIVIRFFGPVAPRETSEDMRLPDEPALFDEIDRTEAMLAWTGDKRFLWTETRNAFVMYQVQGHSWIVMGDPVGPKSEWPGLLWRLRERADAAQGRLLLYQVSIALLPFAIDLGLQLVKYGEEARIDLARFTLDGPEGRGLRYSLRRAQREGASFAIVPASEVPGIMAELRQVSDSWLKAKGHSEKAFSVGRFDPAYIARFDCAVIRKEGKIVAFANIWATCNRNELSVDLMRHVDGVPYGTMDLLFIELMQWGREHGYRWFSLGIAPLSGLEARRLAPVWAWAGAYLYRHGEMFYGFEGLRAYKDKFSPVWEPRYIAGPSGLGLVRALIDLRTLVSGAVKSSAHRAKLALAA